MRMAFVMIRDRLDRAGILLSGLCAIHCLVGLLLVTALGLGGELLLSPEIHRVGLGLAIAVGLVTIGLGALRHGRVLPLVVAGAGLSLMGSALAVGHGPMEAVLTILGVALVASAHVMNLRHAR